MIDFIPINHYYDIFIHGALIIVLFTIMHTWILRVDDRKNISYIQTIGYLLLIFLIIYIGLRPISGRYFTDMRTYANHFYYYASGGSVISEKDVFFHMFMKVSSSIMSVHYFFLLCAALYIYPMYKMSKTFFKEYWFYSFFMFVVSFSFWSYGVNGIRNGIATSLFLWGISYQNNKIKMITLFVIATLFHNSLLLPIMAYVITIFYNKPKFYLACWLAAIPLSIALGGFWESLFASVGFADDRLGGYLTGGEDQPTGFRFDFLFYSAFPIFSGCYFIFKKKFKDVFYNQLFCTYLIANGFWVLVIRASFSNRFAYLSWFMMAVVIVYPMLKERLYRRHHVILGGILFLYFSFTFLMSIIYYA